MIETKYSSPVRQARVNIIWWNRIEFLEHAVNGYQMATRTFIATTNTSALISAAVQWARAALQLNKEARLETLLDNATRAIVDKTDIIVGVNNPGQGCHSCSPKPKTLDSDTLSIIVFFVCDNSSHVVKYCPHARNTERAADKSSSPFAKRKLKMQFT